MQSHYTPIREDIAPAVQQNDCKKQTCAAASVFIMIAKNDLKHIRVFNNSIYLQ